MTVSNSEERFVDSIPLLKEGKFTWPHNGENIFLFDSPPQIDENYLKREIVQTQLKIEDFGIKLSYEKLVKVFPNLKEFKYVDKSKIVLVFHNDKDALEAFHSGKEVEIENWKINVIFERVHFKPSKPHQFHSRSPPR